MKLRTILLLLILLLVLLFVGAFVVALLARSGVITAPDVLKDLPKLDVEIPFVDNGKRPPIGINANEIHHEDASLPFVDLFRMADPFKDNPTRLTTEDVEFDDKGWPIRLNGGRAGTKFIGQVPPEILPSEQLIVLYEGKGNIRYGHDLTVVSEAPGRDVIAFGNDKDRLLNGSIIIEGLDESDPIRNIRVVPFGGICQNDPYTYVPSKKACSFGDGEYLSYELYHDQILFNPDYLSFMKHFQVIRFMAMSGITRNGDQFWSQRPTMDEVAWGGTYGQRGAPIEVQVELANRLKSDAWFNVPHAADDEYVLNTAAYVFEHLDPSLKAYIEYTNETWNTNFSHSEYTQQKGIELGFSRNAVEAGEMFYVKRSLEVFDSWAKVFNNPERLVRVLGSWDTRPDLTKKLLSYNDAYKNVDAVAIAPYFGGNLKGYRESETVDEIFELTSSPESYRSLPEIIEHVETQAKIARHFGVQLVAYEGGQGLVDWATRKPDQHPNPLFFAANRDPRMGELYKQMFEGWQKVGGGLFVAFSAPRTCQWYGCWGLKEHIRQERADAPKFNATVQFMDDNADWEETSYSEIKKPKQVKASFQKKADDEPLIVFRPARDPERYFFLENPRTLDTLVSGDTWQKKDLFGKWQGKWDKDYLYLVVRAYDDTVTADSEDPTQDDSVEFFIDADNSRKGSYDGKHDFHFIFQWDNDKVVLAGDSPQVEHDDFSHEMKKTNDGYVLEAKIPWEMLGVEMKVTNRVGIEVQINDDDDGGDREQKIAWLARDKNGKDGKGSPDQDPRSFGVVLISGR